MLVSCKCLNFIASSSSNQQQLQQQKQPKSSSATAADETADSKQLNNGSVSPIATFAAAVPSNLVVETSSNNNSTLAKSLLHAFLQKYPRTFIFYSQCMDFFKQSIGPLSDITINAINQRDLIYCLTLEVPVEQTVQSWQLSICINCNVVLCAKRILAGVSTPIITQQFLLNSSLITNNDELSLRRADKSFSETFGILIMDHPEVDMQNGFNSGNHNSHHSQTGSSNNSTGPVATFTIGSLSSVSNTHLDAKQQRLKQLHCNLQQRLKKEIAETNERIQRYTEQQFALLKSFREKSEQEYDLLVRLIHKVPDQNGEFLDRLPPMLEVSAGAVNYSRRRNTISSRRELNAQTPTTPTTPNTTQLPPNFLALTTSLNTTSNQTNNIVSAMETNQNTACLSPQPQVVSKVHSVASATSSASSTAPISAFSIASSKANAIVASTNSATTTIVSNALNRKMSNFDTPPATPEATPMSIGNSPTFKQQQDQQQQIQVQRQQNQQYHQPQQIGFRLTNSQSFQQQFPTPTMEQADEYVFELEDVDSPSITNTSNSIHIVSPPFSYQQQQNIQLHLQLQRQFQQSNNDNTMSDLDESDVAEEAEDALDLDTSMPIPMNKTASRSTSTNSSSQMLNFAKSLPIEIANSPMATRSYVEDSDDEVLDNTVDIAASIKALAKSVHGEAVFGDLPRPRLRSQI